MSELRSCGSPGTSLLPEVVQLVDYVWEEASGQLGDILSVPVESVKVEQVDKAEAALLSIRRILDEGKGQGEGEWGRGNVSGEGRGGQGEGEREEGERKEPGR